MPGFHHPVISPFRRDGAAVELARQPNGEIADIDHLLDLAETLRHDLAGLERHETAEVILGGTQLLREYPDELPTSRRRDRPPCIKGLRGPANDRLGLVRAGDPYMSDEFAGDRRCSSKAFARKRAIRHSQPGQNGERFVAHRGVLGRGSRS